MTGSTQENPGLDVAAMRARLVALDGEITELDLQRGVLLRAAAARDAEKESLQDALSDALLAAVPPGTTGWKLLLAWQPETFKMLQALDNALERHGNFASSNRNPDTGQMTVKLYMDRGEQGDADDALRLLSELMPHVVPDAQGMATFAVCVSLDEDGVRSVDSTLLVGPDRNCLVQASLYSGDSSRTPFTTLAEAIEHLVGTAPSVPGMHL